MGWIKNTLIALSIVILIALIIGGIIYGIVLKESLTGGVIKQEMCNNERISCYDVCNEQFFFKGTCKDKCEEEFRLCTGR